MTRQEAIKSLEKLRSFHCGSYAKAIDVAIEAIGLEVVRCKDCESWGLNATRRDEKGEVIYGDCLHFCFATPKWFYCAWGERREDEI